MGRPLYGWARHGQARCGLSTDGLEQLARGFGLMPAAVNEALSDSEAALAGA